ncbi:MAG: type IV pilin [Methanospirillum sp.]
MPTTDDAVSEVIGGALLIALVVIGAAIIGTYVMSQPQPEKIPKVQFSVKQIGDTLYITHEGGETIDKGTIRVEIDGVLWAEHTIANWGFGDLPIPISVNEADKAKDISVSLVYNGGSGQTLMRSVKSPYGFYVFPSRDPIETINLPPGFNQPRDFTCWTYAWPPGPDPQPFFAPLNAKHVYVAASDSTITPSTPPLFICDGTADESEIDQAISIAQGGVVELLDGHFHCSGGITLADHTTLIGQGSLDGGTGLETVIETQTKSVPIVVKAEYTNLGGFTLRGDAFIRVERSHARLRDIYATSVGLDGVWHKASERGMLSILVCPPQDTVDDVEFYRCTAFKCHTHGFHMDQEWDGTPRATTNIRFVQCRATLCGFGVAGDPGVPDSVTADNESRSEWITGFDLHEWQDLVNCEVIGCVAQDNWESGFHLEPGGRYDEKGNIIADRTVSKNIVFRDCLSTDNGQRNTYDGHFFMSGYYLSRDTHLFDCFSWNNRNAGYYVHGGADCDFENCHDGQDDGILADDGTLAHKGSTYGWKVCKASSDITLTGCKSFRNLRWGLWLSFSKGIKVYGFEQTDTGGDRGYQNMLGWYKDEPAYQQPVTDSEFSITAIGNTMPIINRAGAGNTYDLSYG